MSKRCHDPDHNSSRSPSPSKRRHSRCRRQVSQGRSSSSSSRSHGKSKKTCKTRKSYCDSAKSGPTEVLSIENKVRIEHLPNSESGRSEVKKRERKNTKREAKRRKKKKKRITDRKKLSGSSACSRLIELLLKNCTCLESLDSSCTFPNGDNACCCKCRFCRPADCESKSVQCDDSEHFFAPAITRSRETRGSGREANKEANGRSWECLTHDESSTGRKKNDFRGREYEASLNIRSQKRKHKSDSGICGIIVRSFSSIKNFGKRRYSTKSLINDHEISDEDLPKFICQSEKDVEPVKPEEKNCRVDRRCRIDDRSKSTKALRIVFDIVFWPYTCLPGQRSVRK